MEYENEIVEFIPNFGSYDENCPTAEFDLVIYKTKNSKFFGIIGHNIYWDEEIDDYNSQYAIYDSPNMDSIESVKNYFLQ